MPRKETEASEVKGRENIPIGEIGQGKGVERVTDNDFEKAIELEAFMHQELEIVVAADSTPGSLEIIPPNVNGINMPILRGKPTKVKRKYVEALARSRVMAYIQETPDPRRPENIQMREVPVLTYPFSVLHDPHPNGKEWLQAILDQPF